MHLLRRPIACLLLIWYLPACATYTYEPTQLEPAQAVADQKEVMVTVREDGGTARLRVKDPWVRNDSLGGTPCTRHRDRGEQCATDALAVPLQSVVKIETKVPAANGGRSDKAALAMGGIALFAAFVAVAVGAKKACDKDTWNIIC